MKILRKIGLVVLVVICLLMSVQSISLATSSEFVVKDGVLTTYNGKGGNVVIPNNLGITAIGDNVFKSNDALTSVVIPSGVKTIGTAAFQDCVNLISITMPTGLTTIGNYAFAGNTNYYFNSITVPEGVVSIGDYAISGCHYLQSVTLPHTLTTIGAAAFLNSYNINYIYVPVSVTTIGERAFSLGKFPPIAIEGVAESYAETYAKANSIVFSVTAVPSTAKMEVNGAAVSIPAYNIDGSNYFKLRDLAQVLNGAQKQFEVGYYPADANSGQYNNMINITTGKSYTPAGGELAPLTNTTSVVVTLESTITRSVSTKLYIDSSEMDFDFYNINGNNYFKLRDIAKAVDFGVTWDAATSTVMIDTTKGYN